MVSRRGTGEGQSVTAGLQPSLCSGSHSRKGWGKPGDLTFPGDANAVQPSFLEGQQVGGSEPLKPLSPPPQDRNLKTRALGSDLGFVWNPEGWGLVGRNLPQMVP